MKAPWEDIQLTFLGSLSSEQDFLTQGKHFQCHFHSGMVTK